MSAIRTCPKCTGALTKMREVLVDEVRCLNCGFIAYDAAELARAQAEAEKCRSDGLPNRMPAHHAIYRQTA